MRVEDIKKKIKILEKDIEKISLEMDRIKELRTKYFELMEEKLSLELELQIYKKSVKKF